MNKIFPQVKAALTWGSQLWGKEWGVKRGDSEMAQLPPAREAPSQLVGGSKGEPATQFWSECWEGNRRPGEAALT